MFLVRSSIAPVIDALRDVVVCCGQSTVEDIRLQFQLGGDLVPDLRLELGGLQKVFEGLVADLTPGA